MLDPLLLQSLRALEEQLLSAEVRADRVALDRLLDDDFVEIGSSGRRFDKGAIIAALVAGEAPVRRTLDEFAARLLAPGLVLVTYRAVRHVEPAVVSRRSSIWQQQEGRWRMLFNQGTLTG